MKTKSQLGTITVLNGTPGKIAITLSGETALVIQAVVDALPTRALEQLRAAIAAELDRREQARDHH